MGFNLNNCYSHPGKLLKVHLENVALLSKRITSSDAAELVSLFHDIGKVNPNFQQKLNGSCPKGYDHHAYLSAYAFLMFLIKNPDIFIIRKTKCYRFTKRNVPKRKTKRLRYRCPPEPYSNSVRTDFFSYSNAIILENQQINTSI